MAYRYPEPKKTSCLQILAFIRDRVDAGYAVNVNDIVSFLDDIHYETQKHRRNDASQRLRTLHNSGYLKKLAKEDISSSKSKSKGRKAAGRPASAYTLSENGRRYAQTLAELYLDSSGQPIDRTTVLKTLNQAFVLIDESLWRAIVIAKNTDDAAEILKTWSKNSKRALKLLKIYPFSGGPR